MFKNDIVVTLRNLRRNKGYSVFNILGLALSLGLGLLLIQMIASFNLLSPALTRSSGSPTGSHGRPGP